MNIPTDPRVTAEIYQPAHVERTPTPYQNGAAENQPTPKLITRAASTFDGLEVRPRQWLVQNWIPMGVVTGFYGDGGLGKTLLAQQLQTSTALGRAWAGLFTEQVISLGVYCEDSQDELHRRQDEINGGYGCSFRDLASAHWLPRLGDDNVLMHFGRGGVGELTPFHRQVKEAALDLHAKLVIVDTVADTFGGNENDRGQVRQFISRALGSIATAIDGAVVACAHPSRSGLNSGEGDGGSTGWSNTFRSRLFLTVPEQEDGEAPDHDARVLRRRKANYAARHDEVQLRWQNGLFVPDAPASSSVSPFSRRPADDVFLDLLDALTAEQRPLSDNARAPNYAPRLFAKRPANDRQQYREADFARAMEVLFAGKSITIEEYGRPGDRRRKIVRCGGSAEDCGGSNHRTRESIENAQ